LRQLLLARSPKTRTRAREAGPVLIRQLHRENLNISTTSNRPRAGLSFLKVVEYLQSAPLSRPPLAPAPRPTFTHPPLLEYDTAYTHPTFNPIVAMESDLALQYLFGPAATGPYPAQVVQHLQKKGLELGNEIHDLWNTLRALDFNFGDRVRTRWANKRLKDRQRILDTAWPGMPKFHRPECFGNSFTPYNSVPHIPPPEYVWPYINMEDLEDKTALLIFLGARVRYNPEAFALSEQAFMPAGELEELGYPQTRMHLKDDHYGAVKQVDRETAINDEFDAVSVSAGRGLLVLFVQKKIYQFLIECSKQLLQDCDLTELKVDYAQHPLVVQDPKAHQAEVAAKAPYHPRKLDLSRARHLVSTQFAEAGMNVWQLREDPAYFATAYQHTADHDHRQIPDARGMKDATTAHPRFVALTLNMLVAQSHYTLVIWDQLRAQLEKIESLRKQYEIAHPYVLEIGSLEPIELRKAIQFFLILLLNATKIVMTEIQGYVASPKLRQYFKRTTNTNPDLPDQIVARPLLHEVAKRFEVCGLLQNIVETDGLGVFRQFPSLRFRLDLLDTYLRKNVEGWEWISDPIQQAMTKLSVLTECSLAFELQPWYKKLQIHTEMASKDEHYLDGIWDPFKHWLTIFGKIGQDGFISSPELGDPANGRFDYPVYKTKTRKKNVDQLCLAEANLDAFWSSVDATLEGLADGHAQEALQRLLDEGGDMRRTKPWSEHHREWSEKFQAKTPASLPSEDLYDHQPLSQTFHDSSKEITGSFDKSSILTKTKEKTRGATAAEDAPADPTRDLSPEPPRKYKVSKKAHSVFTQLFHNPDDNTKAAGEVKWQDFVTALTNLGFSAQQMHGSQWQFNPSEEMHLPRGIAFHQPHPGIALSHDQARHCGARLHRAYGWDSSTFELN